MMTSSSDPPHRGVDSMVVVYALLKGHPATDTCRAFLAARSGWLIIPATLLEAFHVLVKVYGVDPDAAVAGLSTVAVAPMELADARGQDTLASVRLAQDLRIDLTDAQSLITCERMGVSIIATDDARLTAAAEARGFTVENPITPALRQEVAAWEAQNLPPKGLPRVLHAVDLWLGKQAPELSTAFRTATGGYSHLP